MIAPAGGSPASGIPAVRERLVPRTALIERLLRNGEPVISLVAPPGYGKTTLLAQWAHQVGPRVAWVSCEHAHNDPVALWGTFSLPLAGSSRLASRQRASFLHPAGARRQCLSWSLPSALFEGRF